jgi:hypothetical protein
VGREPGSLPVASGLQALEYPQVTDSADVRRSFQDQVCDEFGEQGAWNVRGNVVDQLRGDARDEVVGGVCQTVLITDSVLHDQPCPDGYFLCG